MKIEQTKPRTPDAENAFARPLFLRSMLPTHYGQLPSGEIVSLEAMTADQFRAWYCAAIRQLYPSMTLAIKKRMDECLTSPIDTFAKWYYISDMMDLPAYKAKNPTLFVPRPLRP